MKKYALTLVLLFTTSLIFAQDKKVEYIKNGDLLEATYYYDDGSIQQEGTFKDGKLHGTWTSYDFNGNKLSVGNYENGKKVGKWLFWVDGAIKEVDYIDSKIVTVYEYTDKRRVAVRN